MKFPASLCLAVFVTQVLSAQHVGTVPLTQHIAQASTEYPFWLNENGATPPAWTSNETEYFNPANVPSTGKTRYYDLHIQRGTVAPDGYQKSGLLINGQFPGPLIEANWGDWIQVSVYNEIESPEEGTTLHWHGLLQKETPWYDGVPSVSQCPIAPGSNFTYTFRADSFGTSWYHSHYSAQYSDGLQGPMMIYGPSQVLYDVDLGPVVISDWYHDTYFDILEQITGTDQDLWAPASDNNLINGVGLYNCSAALAGEPQCQNQTPYPTFQFTPDKTYRLRLMNTGAEGFEYFTIDDHVLTVIANDFVPVVPYNTTVVTLGIGQRTDVVVYASGHSNSSYWMRANNSLICGQTKQPLGLAVISYPYSSNDKLPQSQAWPFVDDGFCANDALNETAPYFPITPPEVPSTVTTLEVNKTINSTGHQVWTVNNSSFRGDYNAPILLLATEKNLSYPLDPEWNVYDFASNTSIRLVVNNDSPFSSRLSHPMHMHGHDFFVLAEGAGRWDGQTVVRPQNPQRRDTQMLRRAGYTVLDFIADNPGVWPFHCHIAWHVSEGLYINIMERPANITEKQIPAVMEDTCVAWTAYTNQFIPDQIDSGL